MAEAEIWHVGRFGPPQRTTEPQARQGSACGEVRSRIIKLLPNCHKNPRHQLNIFNRAISFLREQMLYDDNVGPDVTDPALDTNISECKLRLARQFAPTGNNEFAPENLSNYAN